MTGPQADSAPLPAQDERPPQDDARDVEMGDDRNIEPAVHPGAQDFIPCLPLAMRPQAAIQLRPFRILREQRSTIAVGAQRFRREEARGRRIGLAAQHLAMQRRTEALRQVVQQKQDKGQVLRRCLALLSREHGEIVDLVYYQELSIEEAASVIGIPENTVKTRLFHARKRLAEIAKTNGLDRGWP